MSDQQVLDMFRDDKTWLEDQPEMTPWDEGCQRLAGELGDWLEGYSQIVCEETVQQSHPGHADYVDRLWRCLGHHWRQAAEAESNGGITAGEVASRIQSGRGYVRGGRLGGDPLRDVVLAVAMTGRDGTAPVVFQSDYYGFSRGLARRLNRRLIENPDDWWNDLVDHLAGYTNPPGRLDKFAGRCALQNWLGTVVWNFLKRWIRQEWKLTGGGEIEETGQTGHAIDESLLCFVELVREALARMSKDDVLLLYYLYYLFIEGLKQREVAAILGIVPGNVTRRRQKAIERLQALIEEITGSVMSEQSGDDFFKDIMEEPKAFAESLRKAIEEMRKDES